MNDGPFEPPPPYEVKRDFAVTFTYIVKATSASDAMSKMGDSEPTMEPDRITVLPNMGI